MRKFSDWVNLLLRYYRKNKQKYVFSSKIRDQLTITTDKLHLQDTNLQFTSAYLGINIIHWLATLEIIVVVKTCLIDFTWGRINFCKRYFKVLKDKFRND